MSRTPSVDEMQPNTGRFQKEDNTVINIADMLFSTYGGETKINGKTSGTSFGVDFTVATEKPDSAGKWDQGINFNAIVTDIQNGGYFKITPTESTIEVATGSLANGSCFARSKKQLRYQPGIPAYGKFTAAFPSDVGVTGDYIVGIGMLNVNCGYAMVKKRISGVSKYQFLLRRKTVDIFYDLDGDDMSAINFENLNIFRIDYGYLGVDSTKLRVRDEENNKWLMVHKQVYNQRITNIETPNLSCGAFAKNLGNTTDIKIINGSFQFGTVDGGSNIDPSGRSNSQGIIKTGAIAGTRLMIYAFKNPTTVTMYDSVNSAGTKTTRVFTNDIASKLQEVKFSTDGTKPVNIELLITDIANITSGTFNTVESGVSVLDVSIDAVINFTGAKVLDAYPLQKIDSIDALIVQDYLLFPGQVAAFVYTTTNTTDLQAFIKYNDLF